MKTRKRNKVQPYVAAKAMYLEDCEPEESPFAHFEKALRICFLSCLFIALVGSSFISLFKQNIWVVILGASMIFVSMLWAVFGIYRYNKSRRTACCQAITRN